MRKIRHLLWGFAAASTEMEGTVAQQGKPSVSKEPADQLNRLHPCREPVGGTCGCQRVPPGLLTKG